MSADNQNIRYTKPKHLSKAQALDLVLTRHLHIPLTQIEYQDDSMECLIVMNMLNVGKYMGMLRAKHPELSFKYAYDYLKQRQMMEPMSVLMMIIGNALEDILVDFEIENQRSLESGIVHHKMLFIKDALKNGQTEEEYLKSVDADELNRLEASARFWANNDIYEFSVNLSPDMLALDPDEILLKFYYQLMLIDYKDPATEKKIVMTLR